MKTMTRIQKIKDFCKTMAVLAARQILKVLWIFPLKRNRILFSTFEGKYYSDSPKYIFLDLYEKYGNRLEYIWCRNDPDEELAVYENVRTVRFLSVRFVLAFLTCGVYVTNLGIEPCFPKRKGQLFINTWHGGGAYKGLTQFDRHRKYFRTVSRIRAGMTDCFISSCSAFTQYNSKQWMADETKFLKSGMPRNDILLREQDNQRLIGEIRTRLGIPDGKKIVLYAPTFRGIPRNPEAFSISLDVEGLVRALDSRFGGNFVFLFRCHQTMLGKISAGEGAIDVSSYNDMQELLLVSDVLVTDYSSSIWDFSLTFRPGFLFMPDLDEYEAFQGFLTPVSEWPFPYARTNEGLVELIAQFDEEANRQKIESHHKNLVSFETGTAVFAINKIIQERMKFLSNGEECL